MELEPWYSIFMGDKLQDCEWAFTETWAIERAWMVNELITGVFVILYTVYRFIKSACISVYYSCCFK